MTETALTAPAEQLYEGDRVEVTVGPIAHGGHCVARHAGQVIFVRHALPGERVVAEITEVHKKNLRAEAVTVLEASADRITPRCPYAHADGCGGCDLQHVARPAQLEWKAAVVREQLARLGGLAAEEIEALDVTVAQLPGGDEGWRTRVSYHVDAAGRAGLLKHRSNEVVAIDRCRIAHPDIQALDVLSRRWPDTAEIDVVRPADGGAQPVQHPPQQITERAAGHDFAISADGFWQVHPAAADTLVQAVLDLLAPAPGEHAWDLYGGAGLFAAGLADRVGVTGHVTLVEAAREGAAAARANLAGRPVSVVAAPVEKALHQDRRPQQRLPRPDVVVLDPPRKGAGAAVVRGLVAAAPRAVAYVACDPAAFARDVRTFREAGWQLKELRAFDCFPQTHHVECVALLVP
ncbi:23S rRNA methyltransferase [Catellatospora sp. TT07R-123]|uniref:class I SAM-dependent RNA methyltransferase n=1 Tax=Catellatospora sp. TT07R-123 TaxID=2733863 RepID=UPI001B0407B1|nr:TRAM domain-containing protein [Catellatospora sp. TT07R-123]GHJ49635.1 23S rRNA methyltransferase [Catellatospora sp. TT07R-123]